MANLLLTITETYEQAIPLDEARRLLGQPNWSDEQVLAAARNPDSWTHDFDARVTDRSQQYDGSTEVDVSLDTSDLNFGALPDA